MSGKGGVLAPGARVVVRDAEWLVRRVDRTSSGGEALSVVGISELVRNMRALFLTEVDRDIQILDPVDTALVPDQSHGYQASLLYMESCLRQKSPTDEHLYIGHRGAMDLVPYQLVPAAHALKQPRPRILIADSVGLGKTLEAGILLSELIRRGRGKRILVLVIKSMLTQFQKEMWNRFSIPLTRLDSLGIQRIRSRIPTNHNPFYYYDRAIISIDTLKQDAEYRTYLENAYWDIIVIDEAQNVAERGGSSSLRARLAKLLSERSDTLIMLSATPHDGKARSFASLMNMLDPTAIADPENYGPEDIKGLFVRRFKKDIQHQVRDAFKERIISEKRSRASHTEEKAFSTLVQMKFTRLDQRRSGEMLFRTVLEKALFSSPRACIETIEHRRARLEKLQDPQYDNDILALMELLEEVKAITPERFSKYLALMTLLRKGPESIGWSGKEKDDRLVIFTERIETLRFLEERLKEDLSINESAIETLHGTMSDIEQQRIVEEFGKEESPVRLLIASDVASEGINLHFLSHRMIHFDIPWSLMVFQQRNGRIDRYGQEKRPEIVYLITQSEERKIKGDMRILELLIRKEEEARKNIGDPAALMNLYDIDAEEGFTARAIQEGKSAEEVEKALEDTTFDPLALLMQSAPETAAISGEQDMRESIVPLTSLFVDDYAYLEAALTSLSSAEGIQVEFHRDSRRIELMAPKELEERFLLLPAEIWPDNGVLTLTASPDDMKKEIAESRKEEHAWPRMSYLWPLNPVVEWVNDRMQGHFRRHEAPVISLNEHLEPGETIFIMSGLIPNRKGHPLVHAWFGVSFIGQRYSTVKNFEHIVEHIGLGRKSHPNRGEAFNVKEMKALLSAAVVKACEWLSVKRAHYENIVNPRLNDHYKALERLRSRKHAYLEERLKETRLSEKLQRERRETEKREIDNIFDSFIKWVEDTHLSEDNPFIQVIAVIRRNA